MIMKTLRVVTDKPKGKEDVLKVVLTPDEYDMHEICFLQESTEQKDPTVTRFYLSSEDMIEFQDTLSLYILGFINGKRKQD